MIASGNEKVIDYFMSELQSLRQRAATFSEDYPEVASELVKRLFHAGLMSFMAGGFPSRVRFLLPLGCIDESHIDLACQIIERVVAEMAE